MLDASRRLIASIRTPQRPLTVSDSVEVLAPPDVVWAAVADPTLIARFSPENTGADAPSVGPLGVGARFVGHNRRGRSTWSTSCEVIASDPGERFAFRVDRWGSANVRIPVRVATWEFVIASTPAGSHVTQTWHDDRPWPDAFTNRFDSMATGGRTFAEFQRRNIRRSLDNLAELLAT